MTASRAPDGAPSPADVVTAPTAVTSRSRQKRPISPLTLALIENMGFARDSPLYNQILAKL